MCIVWHLASPSAIIYSWWGEKGVRVDHLPASAVGKDALAMREPYSLLRLILLCLSSAWVKCCSIQCLCELCLSWQLWYLQTLQWEHSLVLLLLVVGNRCHLLDSLVQWARSPTKYTMAQGSSAQPSQGSASSLGGWPPSSWLGISGMSTVSLSTRINCCYGQGQNARGAP